MRNVFLVVKHEIASMMGKRSFWIMTFLFPMLILGLNIGVQVMSRRAFEGDEIASGGDGTPEVVGYVDPGGLIAELPPSVPPGRFRAYPGEDAALAALEAGEIARYYVVPTDVVARGDVVLVDRTFRVFGDLNGMRLFRYVVSYNLVGDEVTAGLVLDPTPRVEHRALAPQAAAGRTDRDNPLAYWVPYATMFILFFSLTMSSGMLLQSVTKEKETRTAEVLLLSLRPRELMLGKTVGLGAMALLQLAVWAGGGLLLLGRGGQVLRAASFSLPPGFVVWLALYFLFGYATYASAMGAIGVLAPTAREGAQFTFLVLLPLMIPLWLNQVFMQEPNGDLATVLSLFPLTAPLAMVTRLAAGGVPLWQPIVGVLALAGTAYVFVLLSARLFRADTLLSNAGLSWRRIVKELRN
jgi:ABC-2 type transport system permease protein